VNEILRKIDWCIHHRWLRIAYDRHIPLLYHTDRGWTRVQSLWLERLLSWFEAWLAADTLECVWPELKDVDREIKLALLHVIAAKRMAHLIPILQTWFRHEVRAVRQMINRTLQGMGQRPLARSYRKSQGGKL
jgi:hypothetical protein